MSSVKDKARIEAKSDEDDLWGEGRHEWQYEPVINPPHRLTFRLRKKFEPVVREAEKRNKRPNEDNVNKPAKTR